MLRCLILLILVFANSMCSLGAVSFDYTPGMALSLQSEASQIEMQNIPNTHKAGTFDSDLCCRLHISTNDRIILPPELNIVSQKFFLSHVKYTIDIREVLKPPCQLV